MELNREQIIKALEICTGTEQDYYCTNIPCPYGDVGSCEQLLMAHSYKLIKELTAENERLGNIINEATKREKENLCLTEEIHKQIKELRPLVASVISDTAREIFEPIINALKYTRFASPLEKQSTLDYIYSLKKKYEGGKRNNDD